MHESARTKIDQLLSSYKATAPGRRALDVGSFDVNGCFGTLIKAHGLDYVGGVDVREGPNVDIVVSDRGSWSGVVPEVDIVICGNTLEHARFPWILVQQIAEVLTPSGLVFTCAPWEWHEHDHPVDCWRVLPEGMRALFEFAELELLEVCTVAHDCFGVARKRG